MKKNSLSLIRWGMFLLNIVILLSISAVTVYSSEVIADKGLGKELLQLLGYMPVPTSESGFWCGFLCATYLLNILIRTYALEAGRTGTPIYISCIVDVFLSLALIYLTNFGYKGVLFLSAVFVFQAIPQRRILLVFTLLYTVLYVFCEYTFVSPYINITSVNTYLRFLLPNDQLNILTIWNTLSSINDVIFLVYMIFWVQKSIDEKAIIRSLYEQQYKINEQLKLTNVQLEQYIEKSEESAKMKERNRLAREIHDTLGHSLTALWAGLDASRELLKTDTALADQQLEKLSEISKASLEDVRRSVRQLRADNLVQFSLVGALKKLTSDISQVTNTKVSFEYTHTVRIKAATEDVLYRTVQESITNAVKHGNATQVNVVLSITEGGIFLYITDNGVGATGVFPNTGLSTIINNVSSHNGTVNFDGSNGFITKLYIPIEEART